MGLGSASGTVRRQNSTAGDAGRQRAKLIWGGEAVEPPPGGRRPTCSQLQRRTAPSLTWTCAKQGPGSPERFGEMRDLVILLCARKTRPNLIIVYHHPVLDARFPALPGTPLVSDAEVGRIVEAFGRAARLAQETASILWT